MQALSHIAECIEDGCREAIQVVLTGFVLAHLHCVVGGCITHRHEVACQYKS